jgi:hypothetical protein
MLFLLWALPGGGGGGDGDGGGGGGGEDNGPTTGARGTIMMHLDCWIV